LKSLLHTPSVYPILTQKGFQSGYLA
jgi:hypothetical protein